MNAKKKNRQALKGGKNSNNEGMNAIQQQQNLQVQSNIIWATQKCLSFGRILPCLSNYEPTKISEQALSE